MRSRARAGLGIALFFSMLAAVFGATAPGAFAGYETVTTTTLHVDNPTPVVTYGSRPKVTATVTSVSAPIGRVQFKVYTGDTFDTHYQTLNVTVAASSATSSTATYRFPATAPGGQTYRVTATFKSSDSDFNDSAPSDTFVTILPASPALP